MEFGKIAQSELTQVAFSLKENQPLFTPKVLDGRENANFKIHLGCAKWGRKDWVGKIYPKGTKDADFLSAYAKQFDCIEFNAIYYKLPTHAQVRKWREMVGADFLFCPKFTEVITHRKRLVNCLEETNLLLDVLFEFEQNLGPLFLMPSPQMKPEKEDVIIKFLQQLPRDITVFLELRHPEWFVNHRYQYIFEACKELNVGTVITDAAGRRDCVHMELTTPQAFIRFVGNSLHQSDYDRVNQWIEQIVAWRNQGIEEVFFFMHQHEELYSPELIRYMIEALNSSQGFNIKVPVFYNQSSTDNLTLF